MDLNSVLKLLSNPADNGSAGLIDAKLPFAEVDSKGIVCRINSLGKIAWGWIEGTKIPHHVEIALGVVSNEESFELPLQLGGLIVGVIPNPVRQGWMLIGYAPREASIRNAILVKSGKNTDHRSDIFDAAESLQASEEIARRVNKETEALSNAKMSFIATLSHEIRSPIGSIAGYTELLEKELMEYQDQNNVVLPQLVFEFLHALSERTSSLQRLVQDLFEVSGLHTGDAAAEMDPVDLHGILRRVCDDSRSLLDTSRVSLIVDLSDSPIHIESNKKWLTQVVENVLWNAIKFTESGEISIRTSKSGRSVIIEIEDTGVGISKEFISQVFDAFSQEDSRRARRYSGTGLGLTLSKKLLERLGGRIEVESEKDVGSLFRIHLPCVSSSRFVRKPSQHFSVHS